MFALAVAVATGGCSNPLPDSQVPAAEPGAAPATLEEAKDMSEPETPHTSEDSNTASSPVMAVDRARYLGDLQFLAQPRPPGSAHWRAVQDMCAARLIELGFEVERHGYGTGQNVIGRLAGQKAPDEWVILSAHYDSTDDTCPGADDNASGVAGLLESARVLASRKHDRTLIVACWDEEERGLIGSRAYADKLASTGQKVVMMYDYEMIGYASQAPDSQVLPPGFQLLYAKQIDKLRANQMRGDFIALIFDDNPTSQRAAALIQQAGVTLELPVLSIPVGNAMKNSPMAASLRRSDHAAFWLHDMPGMMLTDTANFRNTHYHCSGGPDTVDRLDHEFTKRVIQVTVSSALALLRSS